MWAWLASFFISKAVPVAKHAIWRTVSVVCVIAVLAVLVLGVKRIFYPKPTSTQTGGVSYHYDIHPMFGCMRLPVMQEKK